MLINESLMSCLVTHKANKWNSNIIKINKNLYIFKIFNFYIKKLNEYHKFEIWYKNNLLILNLFLNFQFFLYFSFNFSKTKYNINYYKVYHFSMIKKSNWGTIVLR